MDPQVIAPPPPTEPVVPEPQPGEPAVPKSRNPLLIPLIIMWIFIILIASGGAYYLAQKHVNLPFLTKITPTPVIPAVSSLTPTAKVQNIPAGWKAYDGQNISFKYPGNWVIASTSGLLVRIPDDKDFYGVEFSYANFTDYETDIKIEKTTNPSVKIDYFTVDGKRAARYPKSVNEPNTKGFYDSVSVEQIIGMYLISALSDKEGNISKYKPTFDQILGTVKFKKFANGFCGGIDTEGELICQCSGKLTKPVAPPGGMGIANVNIGPNTCDGTCGTCCYKGTVKQNEFPSCQ